jgi:hypothetical protein
MQPSSRDPSSRQSRLAVHMTAVRMVTPHRALSLLAGQWARRLRTMTAATLLTVLLAILLTPTGAGASSTADVQVLHAQSVYAEFETSDTGKYTIDVGARVDLTHHVTSAQTRGEVAGVDELYYLAYATGPSITLKIAGSLHSAWLHATVVVQYCFDEDGMQVDTPACPIGAPVTITAAFTAPSDLTTLKDDYGDAGFNLLHGRLGTADATQSGHSLGASQYAEIVDNLTVTRT